MAGRAIELRVGGQSYRVVTTASPDDLERFAAMVDEKLAPHLAPGRPPHPNAMLLAAISLAHELEQERAQNVRIASRAKVIVESVMNRIDTTLGAKLFDRPTAGDR